MKQKTIAELKKWIQNHSPLSQESLDMLKKDSRIGVQKLIQSYLKNEMKQKKEQERVNGMWRFEEKSWSEGYALIAGVDEAGRGPLAGPVVAAAVILPKHFDATGLNDSKKCSAQERAILRKQIQQEAIAIGVGMIDATEIDRTNILHCTLQAMRIAIQQCQPAAEYVFVDALKLPDVNVPQQSIVKGDQKSHSIAAASIIAKTTRDEWMEKVAKQYPAYHFEQHKGYGTQEHLAMIKKWGPSPIHRRSFAPICHWFSNKGE